jgi:flavodoxin
MKISIAYDSKYGNGKKCVDYLDSILSAKGNQTSVHYIRETSPESLPEADLYVFSTPTHIGGPPRKMKKFLKKLDIKSENAKYALMTTCMDKNTKSLTKMTELLEPKNLTKVTGGIKIKVTGMKGPLETGYEDKLKNFAMEISKK